MRILWYPKRWKESLEDPSLIFVTSRRMRAYNFHEIIKRKPDVRSDIAGYTVRTPDPFNYDVVVFQKSLDGALARTLHRSGILTAWDICDPISVRDDLANLLDVVVASSHELAEIVKSTGVNVSVEVVVDAHEANLKYVKQHVQKDRLRVTWYGVASSIATCLKPIKHVFDQTDWIEIEFATSKTAFQLWGRESGYRNDVQFGMDWREAWQREDSWQHFIITSDVGVVPIFDQVKSPHKILNYMAYGIPVICSPVDSHKRLIEHGVNGFLAESDEEWAHYLNLLRDSELRNHIGAEARKTAECYSVETVANRYYDLLQRYYHEKRSKKTRGWHAQAIRLANRILTGLSNSPG